MWYRKHGNLLNVIKINHFVTHRNGGRIAIQIGYLISRIDSGRGLIGHSLWLIEIGLIYSFDHLQVKLQALIIVCVRMLFACSSHISFYIKAIVCSVALVYFGLEANGLSAEVSSRSSPVWWLVRSIQTFYIL